MHEACIHERSWPEKIGLRLMRAGVDGSTSSNKSSSSRCEKKLREAAVACEAGVLYGMLYRKEQEKKIWECFSTCINGR